MDEKWYIFNECVNCNLPKSKHCDDKCLYEPTNWKPVRVSDSEWQRLAVQGIYLVSMGTELLRVERKRSNAIFNTFREELNKRQRKWR